MNLILKIKENLGVICVGLFFASLWSINKYNLSVLQGIFYTLIGFIAIIGGFLAVLVLSDFVKRFETYKQNQKTNIQTKISGSIEDENKLTFDELDKRMELCRDRTTLYEDLGHVHSLKIVRLVLFSVLFLVLGLLVYLFFPDNVDGYKIPIMLVSFFTTLYYIFKVLFVIYDLYSN